MSPGPGMSLSRPATTQLRAYFERQGPYTVTAANTVEQATVTSARQMFHVILLDLLADVSGSSRAFVGENSVIGNSGNGALSLSVRAINPDVPTGPTDTAEPEANRVATANNSMAVGAAGISVSLISTDATIADTNLTVANQTTGGQNVLIHGIALQLLPSSLHLNDGQPLPRRVRPASQAPKNSLAGYERRRPSSTTRTAAVAVSLARFADSGPESSRR